MAEGNETRVSGELSSTLQSELSTSEAVLSFRIDTAQIEAAWEQISQQIETTVTVTDEQDQATEARYWDQLEKRILKGYQNQAKTLTLQVSRLEFMMNALTQNLEVGIKQTFKAWTGHFDARLEAMINTTIKDIFKTSVNVEVEQKIQTITRLIMQQLQVEINQIIQNEVQKQTIDIVQQVTNNVLANVDNRVDISIESKMVNLRNEIIASVMQDITNLINIAVEGQIENLTFNIDIDAVNAKINNCLQQIAKLETNLYIRINYGDMQLYNWTLAQLIALKGCITDRTVLADQLESFAYELRTKLDTTPCVDTKNFQPWVGMPIESLLAAELTNGSTTPSDEGSPQPENETQVESTRDRAEFGPGIYNIEIEDMTDTDRSYRLQIEGTDEYDGPHPVSSELGIECTAEGNWSIKIEVRGRRWEPIQVQVVRLREDQTDGLEGYWVYPVSSSGNDQSQAFKVVVTQ